MKTQKRTAIAGLAVLAITLVAIAVLSLTGCEQPTTPTATLTGITAAYTGTAAVYPTTPLDTLKTGLTVTANYSNKTSKTLAPADYSLSGTLTVGQSTVTVAYEGKTTTFSVNVTAAALSGTISISPSTGVAINTELTATYSGSETGIAYQWKKDGTNVGANSNKYTPTAEGSYTVTVSATGYQSKTSAAVDVNDPSLSTLTGTITISPNTGVTINTELTATYSGSETVSYQWEKDGGNVGTNSNKYTPTEAGSYTVIVRATGYNSKTSAAVIVTVSAATPGKTLTGITLNTASVKTAYNQNEPLDLSGLVVTASYSDSTSAAVTGYTSSPANGATLSTTETITVTISYTEGAVARTNTFTVTVNAVIVAHTHQWGAWSATILPGTEMRVCGTDSSHIEHRLTGTDRFSFEPASVTSYRVRQGTVTSGEVYIPAYYRPDAASGFLPVTEIGSASDSDGAFEDCTNLTAVHIPETVAVIGGYAFYFCISLTSITIPASVTSIGGDAFSSCTSLTSITFAAGSRLETIGDSAFYYCDSLTGITIPASVTSIGSDAFYRCDSLTSVTFAAGSQLQSIGSYAFRDCTSLTSITIPASVTSIGSYAFRDCTSLTSITFAAGSQLQTIGNWAFYSCDSLTGITIPAGVTSIGTSAFYGCSSLTSITIPAGVTSIGTNAFYGCSNLASITVEGNNPNYASEGGILYNRAKTTLIQAPGGITGTVAIPASVTEIGNYAFAVCTSLAGITIPAGVTSIGTNAFAGGAFYGCTSLATITFAAGSQLQSIGGEAFQYCTSLTSITIPASVTSVGIQAFAAWTSGQIIYIRGHASQSAADSAWSEYWRSYCGAQIKYWNGSSYQ